MFAAACSEKPAPIQIDDLQVEVAELEESLRRSCGVRVQRVGEIPDTYIDHLKSMVKLCDRRRFDVVTSYDELAASMRRITNKEPEQ